MVLHKIDRVSLQRLDSNSDLQNVSFQDRLLLHDPVQTKYTQVQSFKASLQDQLSQCPAHTRRVLQAVAAEACGTVHVVDQRVYTDDGVLVQGVVVVEPGPGTGHLRTGVRQTFLNVNLHGKKMQELFKVRLYKDT